MEQKKKLTDQPDFFIEDEESKMEFEERAAIMEYDGGLTRQEAERMAREIVNGN